VFANVSMAARAWIGRAETGESEPCDLNGARLYQADLTGANLSGEAGQG